MAIKDKLLSLVLVVLSLALLYPGISLPVMTVVGTLDQAGMVDIGQQAIIEARVQKALTKNPDGDVEKLRHKKGRTVRLLSNIMDLDEISGRVEVYRKSSSVLETINTLLGKGYPVVAGLVALFSIIVPVIKNAMLLLAVVAPQTRIGQWLINCAQLIGKWSMADVFLVALFVSFLAFNATSALDGVLMLNASVEPGLYWFSAYCLVSILAGQIIAHKIAAPPVKRKRAKRQTKRKKTTR